VADNSKFVPPKGMRDWLPQETILRQKLIRLIESHYQLYGFQPIDTPVMENIEVLQGKGGGENEKLMFRVMKRGEELLNSGISSLLVGGSPEANLSSLNRNLSDMGLRFDMTVPLARYYGNHANELPRPFRCYHIGPVWRADRPQKGRFREFYQCDIDIVGGSSNSYEVELLLATDRILKALDIGKFKIRVSHKDFLPTFLSFVGVLEREQAAKIAVAIDKLDKQSVDDVLKEIESLKIQDEAFFKIKKFIGECLDNKFDGYNHDSQAIRGIWMSHIGPIQKGVQEVNPQANVVLDPLLVRGFDYYTGPVFEINVEDKNFNFSIGGGGRYDKLIEKLGGPINTPAVGLSLGFERILTILMDKNKSALKNIVSRVFIVNKTHENGPRHEDASKLAEDLRNHGIQVEVSFEKKDIVKQLIAAQENGFEYAITDFVPGKESFKVRQLSNRKDTEMTSEDLKKVLKDQE